jgi:hypothetical protein
MKLDNQVVSLDLAKRLKELGVKQESLCYWYFDEDDKEYEVLVAFAHRTPDDWHNPEPIFSAFTVAELGEMLPLFVGSFAQFHIVFNRDHHGWIVNYCDPKGEIEYEETADTEADARVKMLIYLLENKLIQLPA